MRPFVGIVGLLVALAIVGVLAKKQLGTTGNSATDTKAGTTSQQQSHQIQQQIKATVEGVMQKPRPMPDEK